MRLKNIIPAAFIAVMIASPALATTVNIPTSLIPCTTAFDPRLAAATKAEEIAWLRGFDTGSVVASHVFKCHDGDVPCHVNRDNDYFKLVASFCRRHPDWDLGTAAASAEGILDIGDRGPSFGPMDVEKLLDGIEQSSNHQIEK